MDSIVEQLIYREYGITAISIIEGPRGWVAETFIVTGEDGRRVFAKVLDAPEHFRAATAALPVLETLHAAGITNVSTPRRTLDGEIAVDFDGRRLIVLEYIDGLPGTDTPFSFAEYVRTLARIHSVNLSLPPDVPREDYSVPFAERYLSGFARALHDPGASAPQQAMRRFLQEHEPRIREVWEELLTLPEKCRALNAPFVITHSDSFSHNLLISDKGEIFFIDWDELMMGPVERDNWYYLLKPETRADFLKVYRETFPRYRPDAVLCRYYLLRRFFEDLEGYIQRIMDTPSVEEQQVLFTDLEGSWTVWLWPMVNRPVPNDE